MKYAMALTSNGWKPLAPKAAVDIANERLPQWAVRFQVGDTHGETRLKNFNAALEEIEKTEGDRQKLYALQRDIFSLPDLDMPLQHVFAPGIYLRTIFIPAGGVIIGKIHKHRHGNVLSQGKVAIFTEHGGVEHWEGPVTMVSEAGTKRAVYAKTDTYWTTIHLNPTDTQDLAELEKNIIANSYSSYEEWVKSQQVGE